MGAGVDTGAVLLTMILIAVYYRILWALALIHDQNRASSQVFSSSKTKEGCALLQEVQLDGMDGTSQVLQWQMAMHRDEPCTTSSTSSGEGEPNVPVNPSSLLLANSAAAGHTNCQWASQRMTALGFRCANKSTSSPAASKHLRRAIWKKSASSAAARH